MDAPLDEEKNRFYIVVVVVAMRCLMPIYSIRVFFCCDCLFYLYIQTKSKQAQTSGVFEIITCTYFKPVSGASRSRRCRFRVSMLVI